MEYPGQRLGPAYADSAIYDFTSDITLYAQWSANPTHTVTYANGGGTGTPPTQALSPRVPASPWRATLSRAGFTFTGWNDGTNPYAAGTTYTMGLVNVTLTAQWSALPEPYRDLLANVGSGSMSPQTTNVPTALTANAFTRLGYTFSNWNTAANGSGDPYANGAIYDFTADVTLYAQWSTLPNHTVTFNANGGTGSMGPQTTNVPTALIANAFTHPGYTFSNGTPRQ